MHPDLILFDCDGVLVDSELIACGVVAEELRASGLQVTLDHIVSQYAGVGATSMYEDLERRHGTRLPETVRQRVSDKTLERFRSDLQPVHGIVDLLHRLTTKRCVASSSHLDRIRLSLAVTGLATYFGDALFSATEVAHGKPAPDLFLHAADRMGIDPRACVVVEDSVPGIQAARRAQMRPVGFTGGSHCGADHAERLLRAGAAMVVDRFDAWEDALRRLD